MRSLTRCVRRLAYLAAVTLALAGVGPARAEPIVLTPTDANGIRQFPGGQPFLLPFLSVNGSIEDRAVLQFDLSGLAGPLPGPATLELPLQNLDPGGPAGVIDVFTFFGTGAVTPDQFNAGTFFTSVGNNASGVEHVDVTGAVQAAVGAGQPFLGFRLSTATGDRYVLGPPFTPTGPSLTVSTAVIPEPSTVLLLSLGSLGLVGYGWCRRKGGAT